MADAQRISIWTTPPSEMTEKRKAASRVAVAKYRASEKGRATAKKRLVAYRATDSFRARMAAYRATDVRRAKAAAYYMSRRAHQCALTARYHATDAGRRTRARAGAKYLATSAGRAKKAARNSTAEYRAKAAAYRATDKGRAVHAKYRATEKWRAKQAAYCARHPELRAASYARRRAAKRHAAVAWADKAAIARVYAEAARLTRETGIQHHVDHVYPLLGRTVSGLHVEGNLQILTAADNFKKNNKYPLEVPA